MRRPATFAFLVAVTICANVACDAGPGSAESRRGATAGADDGHERTIRDSATRMLEEGRTIFRYDTFGDETFWGDTLHLHRAIAGEKLGGVGPGVSPPSSA